MLNDKDAEDESSVAASRHDEDGYRRADGTAPPDGSDERATELTGLGIGSSQDELRLPDNPNASGSPEGAVEASRLFSPYRLQVARQARGLTKTALSSKLKISAAALSQFELGQARPSVTTIEALVRELGFPPPFFSSASVRSSVAKADDEVVDSFGHFRSLRSVTATRRRQVLTVAHLLRDVTAAIETHVRLPEPSIPRLTVDPTSPGSAEAAAAAAHVRHELGMDPDGPVDDVLRLLERHGIVCARYPVDAEDVSAFSVPTEQRTFLVLKRRCDARRERDRFSACHELGHLVMHEPGQGLATRGVEAQANAFASEFLMPAHHIRDELPAKVDWPRLLQLKQRWGVSLAALLRRGRDLDVIAEATYVQGVRVMSSRGWNVDEPGTVLAAESPTMLSSSVSLTSLTPADLSGETGWPEPMIVELLTESTDGRPSLEM